MITQTKTFKLHREATLNLIAETRELQSEHQEPFVAAQALMPYLGCHLRENGLSLLGFWTPELLEQEIPPERVFLDLFTPLEPIDFSAESQNILFRRERLNPLLDGQFTWAVIEGMTAGNRDQIGTLYQVLYQSRDGDWVALHDHLAYSLPFGAFAPAEFYDMEGMFAQRRDAAHFAENLDTQPDPDGVPRVQAPSNILQVHVRYASPAGTIAGLTRRYRRIADKIEMGDELTPADMHFIGYDSIQLMPIEPIIEYEAGPRFWYGGEDPFAEEITVALRRPDMTNWGYDIVISGSPSVNPALLESGRPHELLDFIEVCHQFPGKPIKVIFDIVYGHIDNQALGLLNKEYFAGANMYGQNVNFLHPMVRAALIEMMRRKHNYGVDGIRVDGAQDFKWWHPEKNTMIHDDDFLHLMNDLELDVAGVQYRPWMIFEDGRPWPRDDWELASTYREVTKQMPNVWQWGPLTFAHNTPFLFTFWMSKWWRIREMANNGREWITGSANHDTLRRGAQVPIDSRINTFLGDSLPEIIANAYDNAAAKLFDYAMMPGIPMTFINSAFRAPWGFIRNNDDRYGVKVVSEEALWLYWRMDKQTYRQRHVFPRLKELGFIELDSLRRFMDTLDHVVRSTGYYLDSITRLLNSMYPPLVEYELDVPLLKRIARAFMDDVHDLCNITYYEAATDPEIATFSLELREFRRERPWLLDNLRENDVLDYLHPTEGAVIFYGVRHAPDTAESLLFIANMEGAPRTVTPANLLSDELASADWTVALASPGLQVTDLHTPLTLADSEGVVFIKS